MAQERNKPLTAKQRLFIAEYMKDGNGTQAAIRAGYSAVSAHVAANRNLKVDKVIEALGKSQQKLLEKGELTAAKVLADIESVREKAMESGAYQAALKASELQGKALKMWFENHTVETKQTGQTDEQLRARLAELGYPQTQDVASVQAEKEPEHVTH